DLPLPLLQGEAGWGSLFVSVFGGRPPPNLPLARGRPGGGLCLSRSSSVDPHLTSPWSGGGTDRVCGTIWGSPFLSLPLLQGEAGWGSSHHPHTCYSPREGTP